jgi:hypothetical protein
VKEFIVQRSPKMEYLMFEHYNLVDRMK